MENVPVVILAGGQGTRIREETEFRPKAMIPVGERPILWHIMKIYRHHNFNRFYICLGYKGAMIKSYFLNYRAMQTDFTIEIGSKKEIDVHTEIPEDWTVTLCETGLNAMTGARLKKIERYVKGKTFMATYADGVSDINLEDLLKFHKSHGKIATVTGVTPPSRFGELRVKDKVVTKFAEKPEGNSLINGGFFVFNPGVFNYLDAHDACTLEKEPLEKLAEDGQLMVYPHSGYWQCMDTMRDMSLLNDQWNSGKAPWKLW